MSIAHGDVEGRTTDLFPLLQTMRKQREQAWLKLSKDMSDFFSKKARPVQVGTPPPSASTDLSDLDPHADELDTADGDCVDMMH